ncbi:MAG TPA: large conductance mechanosensitive channel protein MscL [Acholeplasmataceae bacterium]|jgi:large conductance mechanosensitive channel|nr:large conductance mechanosensitive channel protein MscL [Acholeplasmataceae bacterium]
MRKFFSDFKQFIQRGNIVDMAVGVIIGGAFGKIVSSFVSDILMPVISLAFGGGDISDRAIALRGTYEWDAAANAFIASEGAILFRWGSFAQAVINFLIIAFVLFLIIKALMALKQGQDKGKEKALKRAQKKKAAGKDLRHYEEELLAEEEARLEALANPAPVPPTTNELLADIKKLLEEQAAKK